MTVSNNSPNPACWRSPDHKLTLNLAMIQLIECDEWIIEDPSPAALKELDEEYGVRDVTLILVGGHNTSVSLSASDYWALLGAFEIFLSAR